MLIINVPIPLPNSDSRPILYSTDSGSPSQFSLHFIWVTIITHRPSPYTCRKSTLQRVVKPRQTDNLHRVSHVKSLGRLQSSSSSTLVIPVNTSCDTGWRPTGHGTLYQTSSQQRQPSHHSALRWTLICSAALFDIVTTHVILMTVWCVPIVPWRLHHVNLIVLWW